MDEGIHHLAKYFPRPREGEEIPIQFIELQKKIAAWSPEKKRTLYLDDAKNIEGLKRVRETNLLKVYNWISGHESIIELTGAEREQFEEVMELLLKNGGEIRYTRKKSGRKMVNQFRLVENTVYNTDVRRQCLAEKL
ncbi:MAG: hypothetical protein ACLFMM_05575 [Methanohalobium sp.]|uniref:hypothetical protein n=1 Tax=Methanohalobium sp. TaxID=2837493 RepID=UPI00397E1816